MEKNCLNPFLGLYLTDPKLYFVFILYTVVMAGQSSCVAVVVCGTGGFDVIVF